MASLVSNTIQEEAYRLPVNIPTSNPDVVISDVVKEIPKVPENIRVGTELFKATSSDMDDAVNEPVLANINDTRYVTPRKLSEFGSLLEDKIIAETLGDNKILTQDITLTTVFNSDTGNLETTIASPTGFIDYIINGNILQIDLSNTNDIENPAILGGYCSTGLVRYALFTVTDANLVNVIQTPEASSVDIPNPPANELSIGYILITDNNTTTTVVSNENIIYIGKHGNDTNSGLNINEALLSLNQALYYASNDNIKTIVCLDDSTLSLNESTTDPFVTDFKLFAPNSTLVIDSYTVEQSGTIICNKIEGALNIYNSTIHLQTTLVDEITLLANGKIYIDSVLRVTRYVTVLFASGELYCSHIRCDDTVTNNGTIKGRINDDYYPTIDLSNYVQGGSSSVDGNTAVYNGTTGKLLKDSGFKAHADDRIYKEGSIVIAETTQVQSYDGGFGNWGYLQEFILTSPATINDIRILFGTDSRNNNNLVRLDLFTGQIINFNSYPPFNTYGTGETGNLDNANKIATTTAISSADKKIKFEFSTPQVLGAGTYHFAVYKDDFQNVEDVVFFKFTNFTSESPNIGRTSRIGANATGKFSYLALNNLIFSVYGGTTSLIANSDGTLTVNGTLLANNKQDTLTDVNFGSFSNGLTEKTSVVDTDTFNIVDSQDGNESKKLSFSTLKTTVGTYLKSIANTWSETQTFSKGLILSPIVQDKDDNNNTILNDGDNLYYKDNSGNIHLLNEKQNAVTYSPNKWFTPTTSISTNGITCTTLVSQGLNGNGIGALVKINNEYRIITNVLDSSTFEVNKPFSENFSDITSVNWAIYLRVIFFDGSGNLFVVAPNAVGGYYLATNGAVVMSGSLLDNNNLWRLVTLQNELELAKDFQIKWSSTTGATGTKDLGLKRLLPGLLQVTNGSTSLGGISVKQIDTSINEPNYFATSPTLDTIGDYRETYSSTTGYKLEKCTVGNPTTKGGGTWAEVNNISITDILTIVGLKVTNQAGTGSRVVTAGSDGTQTASIEYQSAYIVDSATIALLTNASNWNNTTGVYTGTTLDSAYAFVGAKYTDNADYYYEIGSNGLPFRLPKV